MIDADTEENKLQQSMIDNASYESGTYLAVFSFGQFVGRLQSRRFATAPVRDATPLPEASMQSNCVLMLDSRMRM